MCASQVSVRADHGISVALLRPLAELLGRLDADPDAFLAALDVDAAAAPNTYVAGDRVDRLLEAHAAARGDAAFGLTLARTAVVRPFGLFEHMVWLSGTLRDALERAVRFYAVVSRRATLALDEPPGAPTATLRQLTVPGVPRGPILTEFALGSLVLRARAAIGGRFAVRAVRFAHHTAHPRPPAYGEVFDAPLELGAAADELEFDAAQLALPLASANPITAAALEARVAQLVASGEARSLLVDRVRRAAGVDLGAAPSIAAVARRLGLGARTLRRHLEHEGRSLRAIVDEVRRERADELLAAGAAVKEIAFGLGFSEPSAFSRAYKRWTGHAPKAP